MAPKRNLNEMENSLHFYDLGLCSSRDCVAVIIPTFNRAAKTLTAINSVLRQTYKVCQIVVVDDGSESTEFEELKTGINGKPVELIAIEHTGNPGMVRLRGIEAVKTEWVAFLDSDDQWMVDKIEVQMTAARKFGAKAICSNAVKYSREENSIMFNYVKPFWFGQKRLFWSNIIVNSSVLIRVECLYEIGNYATSPRVIGLEDYATWLRIASRTKWLFVPNRLVAYFDDSEDSVRKFHKIEGGIAPLYALLDFMQYEHSRNEKKFKLSFFILRNVIRIIL